MAENRNRYNIRIVYNDGKEPVNTNRYGTDLDEVRAYYLRYASRRSDVHHIEISQELVTVFPDEEMMLPDISSKCPYQR